MTEPRRCDGETLFGFTVKACDKEAIHFPCNTPHECYQFCSKHYYFYLHGTYPDEEPSEPWSFGHDTGTGDSDA
jgi:hypothetical protein